jgi:hypothetical protein
MYDRRSRQWHRLVTAVMLSLVTVSSWRLTLRFLIALYCTCSSHTYTWCHNCCVFGIYHLTPYTQRLSLPYSHTSRSTTVIDIFRRPFWGSKKNIQHLSLAFSDFVVWWSREIRPSTNDFDRWFFGWPPTGKSGRRHANLHNTFTNTDMQSCPVLLRKISFRKEISIKQRIGYRALTCRTL